MNDFLYGGNKHFWRTLYLKSNVFNVGSEEEAGFKYLGLNVTTEENQISIDTTTSTNQGLKKLTPKIYVPTGQELTEKEKKRSQVKSQADQLAYGTI